MKILHLVSPSSLPSWLGRRSISSSSDESSSEPSSTFSCFRFLIIAATALLYYCQLWLYYCIKATFTPVWNCTTRSSTCAKCLLQPGSNSRATVSTPTMGLGSLHSTFQALHVLLGAQFSHLITLSFAIAIPLICLIQTWMILQKCLQGQSNTVAGKLHWVITRFLFGRLCFHRYRLSQAWWWFKETARAMFCVGQNSCSTHQPHQHYDRLFAGRVKTGGQ